MRFSYGNVLLSYVNETMYLLGNLPFFKINVNCSMARDDSPCVNAISKCMLWVKGLVSLSALRIFFSSLISSLIIGIQLLAQNYQGDILPAPF